jgi:putative PEP-CTERM system TPR-repeat lipoprotein
VQQNPDDVNPRIAIARYYLEKGRSQDALAATEPVLSQFGGVAAFLEVVGRAQMAIGRGDNAVTTFKTLTDMQPQAAIAHRYLSNAYVAVRKGDLALAEARTALKLNPNDEAAKFDVARLLMMNSQFEDARLAIDALKKDHPQDPDVAELEGTNALQQNRAVDATAAFQRAIQSRDNSSNRVFLATAQARLGHLDDAEKTLRTWFETHPNDAATHMALGDIALSANRLPEAKEEYGALLKLSPNSFVAENNYAWVLAQLGEPKEALAHARHAAELSPNSPEVLDTLGVILLKNDNATEAVADMKKAYKLASSNPAIQLHLAQALVAAGSKAEALDVLSGLLTGNQNFKDRDEAEKLRRQLAGG